jgi:hypothetical protein
MWENKRMICPVCGYKNLPYPPQDYNICPCCSTEFGNDDAIYSHRQLLGMWIAGGANWFFGKAPENWNPWMQLLNAGLGTYVPKPFLNLRFQADASVESSSAETIAKNYNVALAA